MKVLLINKYNFIKGGSEVYTFGLKHMLKKNGHEVIDFSMSSSANEQSEHEDYFIDEIDYNNPSKLNKIKNSIKLIYSYEAYDKLTKLIIDTKPDIAHVNLIYHQITPSILHALKKQGIPIVFTSHDYKIVCPNYKLYNGNLCEKCVKGKYLNCFKNSCHKNSKLFSLLLSIEAYVHKYLKSYKLIDAIICPSKFMMDKLLESGIEKEKLNYIPNFINPVYYDESRKRKVVKKEKSILYYGRISEEKGLMNLLKAMLLINKEITLKIVGTGPQEDELKKFIRENSMKNVRFLGFMNGNQLYKEIETAYCTVIPSIWHEVFGLTIIESYSFGTPVIGANLGGIKEIIKNNETGYLYNNIDELINSINSLFSLNEREYNKMVQNCLIESEVYSPENIYENIFNLYKNVLDRNN